MITSIIIPNYNGVSLLKKNLPKVINAANYYSKESSNQVEIIVVDDASLDGSVEFVKNQIKNLKGVKLKLVEVKKNRGFSSTVNKGAMESKGEFLVLLNTDVYPEEGFLKPLISNFKDIDVFAVGILDKSIEEGKVHLRGRGIGEWKKGFLVHSRGEIDKRNTLWASGGSAAFRTSLWKKLGGLDEIYNPFYWEDIDLSYRALKSGYKVIFENRSIVFHEHQKGTIKKEYSGFKIKTIAYRNQFIFVWKNATDFILQIGHVLYLPYHFIKALSSRDWPFLIGFLKAFILLPKIIKSSFKAQKNFKIKDSQLIENYKK